jgi:NAD-dependent deacetylase sirtuin 2
LNKKGSLLRCYSQNIDSLECLAGLSQQSRLVQAHGSFSKAHVVDSDRPLPNPKLLKELKAALDNDPDGWKALEKKYGGLVKPSIVFFEEELPKRAEQFLSKDLLNCKLLLVMGTSLRIEWVQEIVTQCCADVKVLVNDEYINMPGPSGTSDWDAFSKHCDETCQQLVEHLGWTRDLNDLKHRQEAEIQRLERCIKSRRDEPSYSL